MKMTLGTLRRPWIPEIRHGIAVVPLTGGLNAIIDLEDLPTIAPFAWSASIRMGTAYAVTQRNRLSIYMHRLVCAVSDARLIDHRDFDGLNNTRANLRICSKQQNTTYSRKSGRGASKFKGAAFHRASGLYHATIVVGGSQFSLGYFHSPEHAAAAYDAAAIKYFGAFAATNKAMGLLP